MHSVGPKTLIGDLKLASLSESFDSRKEGMGSYVTVNKYVICGERLPETFRKVILFLKTCYSMYEEPTIDRDILNRLTKFCVSYLNLAGNQLVEDVPICAMRCARKYLIDEGLLSVLVSVIPDPGELYRLCSQEISLDNYKMISLQICSITRNHFMVEIFPEVMELSGRVILAIDRPMEVTKEVRCERSVEAVEEEGVDPRLYSLIGSIREVAMQILPVVMENKLHNIIVPGLKKNTIYTRFDLDEVRAVLAFENAQLKRALEIGWNRFYLMDDSEEILKFVLLALEKKEAFIKRVLLGAKSGRDKSRYLKSIDRSIEKTCMVAKQISRKAPSELHRIAHEKFLQHREAITKTDKFLPVTFFEEYVLFLEQLKAHVKSTDKLIEFLERIVGRVEVPSLLLESEGEDRVKIKKCVGLKSGSKEALVPTPYKKNDLASVKGMSEHFGKTRSDELLKKIGHELISRLNAEYDCPSYKNAKSRLDMLLCHLARISFGNSRPLEFFSIIVETEQVIEQLLVSIARKLNEDEGIKTHNFKTLLGLIEPNFLNIQRFSPSEFKLLFELDGIEFASRQIPFHKKSGYNPPAFDLLKKNFDMFQSNSLEGIELLQTQVFDFVKKHLYLYSDLCRFLNIRKSPLINASIDQFFTLLDSEEGEKKLSLSAQAGAGAGAGAGGAALESLDPIKRVLVERSLAKMDPRENLLIQNLLFHIAVFEMEWNRLDPELSYRRTVQITNRAYLLLEALAWVITGNLKLGGFNHNFELMLPDHWVLLSPEEQNFLRMSKKRRGLARFEEYREASSALNASKRASMRAVKGAMATVKVRGEEGVAFSKKGLDIHDYLEEILNFTLSISTKLLTAH